MNEHNPRGDYVPAAPGSSGRNQLTREPFDQPYSTQWDAQVIGERLDIARYWQVLFKHKWVVLACVIGCLVLGLSITLLMTPVFKATATIKIDRENARIIDVQGVEPNEEMGANEEFFQTQYGLLKSRALALSVVDRLGLATSDKFFTAMGAQGPGRSTLLAEKRRRAADLFQQNLDIAPVRGSRLVKVSFNSPDSPLAARISNATAEEFITSNLNRRYESSGYARKFLEDKLAETKAKLETSEREVADYAAREKIINVGANTKENGVSEPSQSLTVNSLVALNSALALARGERIKAEERWHQSQTSTGLGLAEVLDNPTVQELSQAKAKLSAEYQDNLQELRPTHPKMVQLKARIDETDRQLQDVVKSVQGSLQMQYQIASNQEKAFEAQVRRLEGSTLDLGQRSIQYGILQREADTNRTLYDGLLQRYKEIGVAGGISANNISIVDRAEVPTSPSKPQPIINLGIAGIAGLAIGLVLAFLLELLDESIATPDDVEQKVGLPLLGTVPKLKGETPRQALDDSRSAFSEAYYSIRTTLQFSTAHGAPRTILVTSSRPAEGKSTSALAVATNFARIGNNVLLVDGDLRNPSMHRQLGLENSTGLSNALTGSMTVEQVVLPTGVRGLHFIPCGPLPPNPAELLASDGWANFVRVSGELYDIVVIDGPPVLGLADAPTLSASVEGTVFVIESRGTRRGWARNAIQRLQSSRGRLVGVILTKFDAKQASYSYGGSYAYSYEYGSKPKISNHS